MAPTPAPEVPVQVEEGEAADLPASAAKRAKAVLEDVDRWAEQLHGVWTRFLKREKGVIVAKLGGSKAREGTKFWDPNPGRLARPIPATGTMETKAFNPKKWIDKTRWLGELEDDTKDLLHRFFVTYFKRSGMEEGEAKKLAEALTNERVGDVKDWHEGYLDRLGVMASEIAERDNSTMEDVVGAIEVAFDQAQVHAEAVAASQMVGAANQAQLEAVNALGLKGKKVWFSAKDHRVRPTHRIAHGSKREFDKPFKVGEAAMQYPGDRSAPIGEWIQCRCVLLFYPVTSSGEPVSGMEAAWAWQSMQMQIGADILEWSEKKAERHVRTPEGMQHYGQPIGSRIIVDWNHPDVDITGHGSASGGGSYAEPPAADVAIRKQVVGKRNGYFADLLPQGATFDGQTDPDKMASRISTGWRRAALGFESDDTTIANALRIAATNTLDVPGGEHEGERATNARTFYDQNKEVLDAFAEAQYRATQEYLKERGVEFVRGFRGANYDDDDPDSSDFPEWAKVADRQDGWVKVQPPDGALTSHSTSLKAAAAFADATGGKSVILRSVIPAEEVFGTYRTGLGMYGEDEVVTRGRVESEARVYDPRELDGLWEEGKEEGITRGFLQEGKGKGESKAGVRHVRTREGQEHYGQSIGSVIRPDLNPNPDVDLNLSITPLPSRPPLRSDTDLHPTPYPPRPLSAHRTRPPQINPRDFDDFLDTVDPRLTAQWRIASRAEPEFWAWVVGLPGEDQARIVQATGKELDRLKRDGKGWLVELEGKSAVRHVRTPGGREKYGEEIGDVIRPNLQPHIPIPTFTSRFLATDPGPGSTLGLVNYNTGRGPIPDLSRADSDFRYNPDPAQRAAMIWQRTYAGNALARDMAVQILEGKDPPTANPDLPNPKVKEWMADAVSREGYGQADLDKDLEHTARFVLDGIDTARPASHLYRGMTIFAPLDTIRDQFREGGQITIGPSSFSADQEVARQYARNAAAYQADQGVYGDSADVQITVIGKPKAMSLDPSLPFRYRGGKEYIAAGTFEVVALGVQEGPLDNLKAKWMRPRVRVTLRQVESI